MIKVFSTVEVGKKLKMSDRSVRRRITEGIGTPKLEGVQLTNPRGGRVVYGVTEKNLNKFLEGRG